MDLPLGLELRGGQFLNRFGFQNAVHNHGWFFVDQNLINGRFLNEGELTTLGGEVTWNVPVPWGPTALSIAYGGLPNHSHNHHHGHEHEEEAEFEAELANFNNWVASANLVRRFDYNDFHQLTGIGSAAVGENEFGRLTQVYGLGFQYEWRENGYEAGARYLRWRTQGMIRGIEALSGFGHDHGHDDHDHHDDHHEEEHHHDEDHHHDEHGAEHDEHGEHDEETSIARRNLDDVGFYTMLAYGWNDRIETSIRGEWVSGIDEMGLDDRWRVSPAFTYFLNRNKTSHFRLQYNYDFSDDFGDEHSVWAQFQWSFGGPEVR